MVISLAEATNTLLSGKPLAWQKFREHRAGSITLSKPSQRRLFAFLLKQDSAKVAQGSEELFSGIVSAWADSDDPAETETALPVEADTQAWRLERIEANGFGGLTLHGGERFEFWTEGDNWCLLGQNGSGKTSLASAILWALTGKRIREQDGPVDEIGQRAPVYAPSGKRIGDWPPLASYPTSPAELLAPADVWVRLTFKSPSGALATAFRKIVSNPDGSATTEVNVDPRLLSAPQLIETGLLMPARIARIGFGEKSQSLYDAVKLLTGLDQLSDIADGCLQFTHAGRRFLRYGKDHGLEGYAARFKENIERARAKANDLAFALPAELEIAVPGIGGALRKAAQEASSDAAAHLQALKSEIGPTVDIATQQGRTRIRTALNTAFGLLSQPISAIAPFNAWVSLKEANDTQQFSQLSKAIAAAESALETALRWHARQNEDHKFRLKALASRFYVPAHTHDEATYCPLCEGMLTTDQQRDLALQLATLKEDAAEAERRLEEVCLSLESQLTTNIPPAISRHVDVLKDMNPRDAYLAAIRERFCLSSPFKDTFSGLATATEAVVTTQYASLPHFEYPAFQPAPGEPAAATALRRNIHVYSRLIALATWWMTNRQAFRDALTSLLGQPDTRGNFASESLHGRLISIELALLKSEPLDELAKFLSAAADAAEAWAPVNAEQKRREEIAEALEPLKDLRFLVAAETAGSIERLSDRIKAILTRIHYQERLSYEQTSIAKRTVTVEGSFASGMQIDAAHVANSSWLRAILWAFVLALREETIAVLGRNPFPLMVLDDPQITFDPRNKLKWAEEIARLANLDATLPESSQLFLTTHERHFYQCMVDHQSLKGKQGLIGGVNKASGVAKIVNGGCLERVFHEASENNDDARARDYISDVRIYCEDLLKCVLRGEGPAIPSLTLGKLAKELKRLHDSRTPPFDRTPFKKLLDTLSGGGGKEIKLINESHHKDDETIGLAQAKEVKAFWEQKLRAQIHDAFELYDNFSSFYGEPRSFPWAKNVVAFPTGARDAIGAAKLQHTGIAAAAKTDGMAGDGIVTVEEWDSGPSVVLPNHEAYQLAAGTLDPVASVGDILIVCNHARVHPRNLVVARVGDALLARRFNTVEAHPGLAVLTGQSVDPAALAEPILIAPTTENCRKIVGTLFVGSTFGIPAAAPKHEIVPVKNPASLTALLDGTRLFQVKGRSAEPIALDGQFLITRKVSASDADLKALDGRLVVAVDENGTRYFKRLRYRSDLIVLESLNPDGTTSAEILSHNGALNLPRLTNAIEVVGVLFELPTH